MGEETNTGFMDKLADLVQNFDPSSFMPELDSIMGWVELAVRVAVMAGPLVILALGLCYMLIPPKEANHKFGYRFYWGMGSVEAWQYTQRLAGLLWSVAGLVLTVIMVLIAGGYRGMDAMEMVNSAVTCLIWQAAVMLVVILVINILVLIRYDRKGERRGTGKGLEIPDLTLSGLFGKLSSGKKQKRQTLGKKVK